MVGHRSLFNRVTVRVMLPALALAAFTMQASSGARPMPPSQVVAERRLAVLRNALAGPDFWPAMHAAEALTLAGRQTEVREALVPRLETETDDQRRCGLARELVRAGDRTRIGLLLEILAKPGSNGHTHAAESLYKVAEVGDGARLREAMARPENSGHGLMAAAALARCGNPSALAMIRRNLAGDDREARKIAAWILGLLGSAADVPGLRENAAREKDPLAHAYAVHALACLGDPGGQSGLQENLRAKNPAIRTYAAEFAGYARIAGARDRLIRLLDDPAVDVRVRAAQALGMLDAPSPGDHGPFTRDVYPATAANPRYSEGSLLTLTDGSLLYATTEFIGGGADHATAHIVSRRSEDGGRTWGATRELQPNVGRQNVMSVTLRRLSPGREDGPIGMMYLVKNGPNDLHAFFRISSDEGRRWGPPLRITSEPGYHVVNNDRLTVLRSGRLVCPVAASPDFQQTNHFTAYCYLSDDDGLTWRKGRGYVDQPLRGAMEPEVLELKDGWLLMILRNQVGTIATALSANQGDTWSPPSRLSVRAPEAPATLRRIPATGDLLLIWNDRFQDGTDHGGRRTPLTAAISQDEGKTWTQHRNLETNPWEDYAYTSVTFMRDRTLLTYYVHDRSTNRISSRFRSVPTGWFYGL